MIDSIQPCSIVHAETMLVPLLKRLGKLRKYDGQMHPQTSTLAFFKFSLFRFRKVDIFLLLLLIVATKSFFFSAFSCLKQVM